MGDFLVFFSAGVIPDTFFVGDIHTVVRELDSMWWMVLSAAAVETNPWLILPTVPRHCFSFVRGTPRRRGG